MNITIDLTLFDNLTIEDCLNYTANTTLEKVVEQKVQTSINKMSKYSHQLNTNKKSKIKFLLEQSLLKISSNRIFLKNKDNLSLELLYTIIKKQFYIQVPFLLD